ncbi:unnamed protein product [Polarella glacialis]|uniref:Uncharacterized protein n=1 Tax=Polarella glacialis TaxID=89957 RepID=A0A813LFF0_POLGL|nr:unnamed protein product [Polarella glacialis]
MHCSKYIRLSASNPTPSVSTSKPGTSTSGSSCRVDTGSELQLSTGDSGLHSPHTRSACWDSASEFRGAPPWLSPEAFENHNNNNKNNNNNNNNHNNHHNNHHNKNSNNNNNGPGG